MDIMISKPYRHLKSGKLYVVKSIGKVETESGEWVASVNYVSINDTERTVYTRSMERFLDRFEPTRI